MSSKTFEIPTRQPGLDLEQAARAKSDGLHQALAQMGYPSLREVQKVPVENVLLGRDIMVVAPTSAGKCFGKGTPVMLASGKVVPVESIVEGDLLMGPDGEPRRVASTCKGREQLYRVRQKRGIDYVVNESHILSLRITNMKEGDRTRCGGRFFSSQDLANVELRDYLGAPKTFRHVAKGWKSPCVEMFHGVVPGPDATLPPYMLGLWLGDGAADGFKITTEDVEVVESVVAYADSIDHLVTVDASGDRCPSYNVVTPLGKQAGAGHETNEPKRVLRSLGLLNHKQAGIPDSYRLAHFTDRLQLLAGLIDSDGSFVRDSSYDFISKHERLAEDYAFVARSLGFHATVTSCEKTCGNTGAVGDYWRVYISGDVRRIPVRVARKRADVGMMRTNPLLTGIALEKLEVGDYYGFTLEGPDRMFLLGDFTVAHNTAMFTVPTLALGWRTLVFSPLVALMRDQVIELQRRGVAADFVNSQQTNEANHQALANWAQGKTQMLYVAPERLQRTEFHAAMAQRPPDMVTIDECFTPETEILTEDGFVQFRDLQDGAKVAQVCPDTKETTFVVPDKIIRKPYKGELVRLWSQKYCDLTMTPNHELLAYYGEDRWKKEAVSKVRFNYLKRFLAAAPVTGREERKLSDLDRFRIAYQADGNLHAVKKNGSITAAFSLTKERKVKRLLQLAKSCGYVCNEVSARVGQRRFLVSDVSGCSKKLSEMFRLRDMSASYAAEFVEEASKWDGHVVRHTGQLYYSSTVEENASFVQTVAVLAGYKTNLTVQEDDRSENYADVFRVFIHTDRSHFGAQALKREEVPYEGYVHCVRVPHGNIIVRGRGKTMVVGNCHCLSQWADNFRSDYYVIGQFVADYKPRVVFACTATCTEEIESDVCRAVGISPACTLWQYYRRENLTLKSRELCNDYDIVRQLEEIQGKTVIYFSTVKRLEEFVPWLNEKIGKDVGLYHGKMNSDVKTYLQDAFKNGDIDIMCATNAFGLGVNVEDIRAVIHHDPPGTPEALAQEVGRAGRDENPAECITFHHRRGWMTQENFIERGHPSEQEVRAIWEVMRRLGSGGAVIKKTGDELAKMAKIQSFGIYAIMETLSGAGCIGEADVVDRIAKVSFKGGTEDEVFQEYKRQIQRGGMETNSSFYDVNLDWLRQQIGVTAETVTKRLKQWEKDGYIDYTAPFRGKPRVLTGDISRVDFERLAYKRRLAWKKLKKAQEYMEIPDREKHDWFADYFAHWRS